MSDESRSNDRPPKSVIISVDGEDVVVPDRDLRPNEILTLAGLDPATNYLVHLEGKEQESFQNHGEDPIKVHQHEKFLALSTGPTPTS